MAIWNEILEGGLNQLLAKRLAMQTGSPTPSISPELGAGLILENDRAEYGFLKGEVLMSGYGEAAAVAGELSYTAIVNPATSGVLATVTGIQTISAVGQVWFRTGSTPGTLGRSQARDFRWPSAVGNFNSALQLVTGSSIALPPTGFLKSFGTSGFLQFFSELVVSPGSALIIYGTTANQPITVNLDWRERAILPGELGA